MRSALFTVNRRVCGDTWCRAAAVARMPAAFRIDHGGPPWPTRRWLGAMLHLFTLQISRLIQTRDRVVDARQEQPRATDVFADRALAVSSYMPVSVDAQRGDRGRDDEKAMGMGVALAALLPRIQRTPPTEFGT